MAVQHLSVPDFLWLLVAMLGAAKVFGALAKSIGQPAVLGELTAGVVLGALVLGVVDPKVEVVHLLAEIGVTLLLFAIGLETDLNQLLKAGMPPRRWRSLASFCRLVAATHFAGFLGSSILCRSSRPPV